ncbi:DUF3307 domain-containing protein [Actibacterium pelagium]|uniref:DUF3307 domain-containing protein n=1 Tax=Actibacterium pelagium TaxID=2029103 RepID=A0A917AF06_9RHOB|nr:DUF3307 domain-containing protein [Actibacterium pelagium]GGE45698.1 hypothetical protein GCM10011517_11680 [Actibacterium pelagium]
MTTELLVLMVLFQMKHMFADYFLQPEFMRSGRDTYLHFGRLAHAAVHATGTAIALAFVPTPLTLLAILAIGDLVIHFHIDWLKARVTDGSGLTPADAGFWRAAGVDQAAHQLTYVAILAVWATA